MVKDGFYTDSKPRVVSRVRFKANVSYIECVLRPV